MNYALNPRSHYDGTNAQHDAQCQVEGIRCIAARVDQGKRFVAEGAEGGKATAQSYGQHQSRLVIPSEPCRQGVEQANEKASNDIAQQSPHGKMQITVERSATHTY